MPAGGANRSGGSLSGHSLPVGALTRFRSLLLSNRPRLGATTDRTGRSVTQPSSSHLETF
jgi:hypothetical protein